MSYKRDVILVELDRDVHSKLKELCVKYDLVQKKVLKECVILGLDKFIEDNIKK